jgi:hypothetical protein
LAEAIFELDILRHNYRNNLTLFILHTSSPVKMERTECFKTLAHKLQMLVNHPEESIRHSEQGDSLKTKTI